MNLSTILSNKQLKAKAKTEIISQLLLNKKITLNELIKVAQSSNDQIKATCIEAIEFATKSTPEIASKKCLDFITKTLTDEAPRVKWESAKVLVNIAHLYPDNLDEAIKNLLTNTEFDGTVVRWSAAKALAQIIKLKTKRTKTLLPAIEAIYNREKDNAIRKTYAEALKKVANK